MKLYCQYSGVNFTLPQFPSLNSSIITVHPIFHADKRHLYSLYNSWQEGEMESEVDRRLLFLALLNSTQLIEWSSTANPSDSLVQASLPNVFYTCKWVTAITLPSMKLPQFCISRETRKLENVAHWLKVWEQIRIDFDAGYKTSGEIERQKNREVMLEKLIKTDNPEGTRRFAGLLAQWAFEAAAVPENIRDYWRSIITSKGISILSINRTDMEEMIEHFEEHLSEHGSIYSHTLLKHLRNLYKQIVTGLGFNITNSVDLVDIVTRSEYSIMDESDVTSTERINVQKLINNAPSSAPREEDYPSKVAFLRAKISWNMSCRAAVHRETAEDLLQERLDLQFSKDAGSQEEFSEEEDMLKRIII